MFKVSNKLRSAVMCSALAGALAFSSIASAFGETAPSGVEIKEFSLLDTAFDVVGAADFTPEGNKDGHFKLLLSLAQKTVINAVVLRSTDDYGKDSEQGVWRTNRVTTGWLLGIVQDKTVTTASGTTHESEIINPGFRNDVNEPVGEFSGELVFDLYASNNGTIKETQYYVLEIETAQGTIVSKPIKYKKPMTSGGTSASPSPAATSTPSTNSGTATPTPQSTTKPVPTPTPAQSTPTPTPASTPAQSTPTPAPVPGDGPTIHIFYKGQELQFENVKPIIKDGSTLVPFRKLFETLGFTVDWVDNGKTRKAIGTKEGLVIELTINSTSAKVNGEEVTLEVPAQIINDSTLVPLRFVAENSGYEVSYSKEGDVATIEIEESGGSSNPGPTPGTSNDTVEPYVVKGYVRDAQGRPAPGVTVFADNTLLYDSNVLGVTDENGYYRLELPHIATSWRMGADATDTVNGKSFTFHLAADVDQPFGGSTGAIRDFTWTKAGGQIYVYPYFTFDDGLPDFYMSDLELTLTPIGKLLDGSEGKTIVKRGGSIQGGAGVDNIPIGKYKATARWVPEGHEPIPMQIRLNYVGKYAESAVFEFDKPRGASTSNYLAELEVRLYPKPEQPKPPITYE
ncbi:stalk domain-containing protein [Paenibacillus sp. MBLB4367]|uniref:stalk domain-containing protein n=1 Tax=Paenibacillus sp. MBLB4367 TaxID=3384767 RepID=UPI0039082D85